LDQKLAFEWVRSNIAKFGGDPSTITAMGQSAGAISLGAHLLAGDGNQKLFDRAILLSGSPLFTYRTITTKQPFFDKLIASVGCTTGDVVECLQNVDSNTLLRKSAGIPFGITLDGTYVSEQPISQLEEQRFSKVPLLVHSVRDEGSSFPIFVNVTTKDDAINYRYKLVPFWNRTELNEIDRLYPVEKYSAVNFAAGDFFGDYIFQCDIKFTSEMYTKAGVPVFSHAYNHLNKINFFRIPVDVGSFHGSELPMLFLIRAAQDPSEYEFSNKLHDVFFNFAKFGKVNSNWPLYGEDGYRFDVETQQVQKDVIRKEKCDFIKSTSDKRDRK
jgi:carboxylesterase type B